MGVNDVFRMAGVRGVMGGMIVVAVVVHGLFWSCVMSHEVGWSRLRILRRLRPEWFKAWQH